MECNKDEALRAKDIAENRLRSLDFAGAHKIALKAQKLFPKLEDIVQLLTVCEVHCSAHKTLSGLQKNWYGILQLESTADESTVKKQYHKLALLLHPDKNKFAYAEAAFKMIGEANAILSDREQRNFYDKQYKDSITTAAAAAPKPPSRQPMKRQKVTSPPAGSNVRGEANISSDQNMNPNLAAPKVEPGPVTSFTSKNVGPTPVTRAGNSANYDEGIKEVQKKDRVHRKESLSKSKPKVDDGLNDTAEAIKLFNETLARQAAASSTKKKASVPLPKTSNRKRKSDDGTCHTAAAVKALKETLLNSVINNLKDYDNQTAYHHYEHVDNEGVTVKRAMDVLNAIPGMAKEDNLFMVGCAVIGDRGRRNAFLTLRTDAARLSWLKAQQSLGA